MILFKDVSWKNFLSTGDQSSIVRLSECKTNLIVGENGSGKSTLLDAITFALYGKPFRNINKPQLLNSVNSVGCEVEIGFEIGKNEYRIKRGISPSIFEIYKDRKLINQDSKVRDYQDYLENVILKLSHKSFCQVVILGSASFVPFMKMPAKDRREIIEDLLDIQIFSAMNAVLKLKIQAMKDEEYSNFSKISVREEKIKVHQKYLESLTKDNKEQIVQKKKQIVDTEIESEKLEEQIIDLSKEVVDLTAKGKDYEDIRKKVQKIEQLQDRLTETGLKIQKDIVFFKETTDCPTCKQTIDAVFRNSTIQEKNKKYVEIISAMEKLSIDLENNVKKLIQVKMVMSDIKTKEKLIESLNGQIRGLNRYISNLESEIKTLKEKKVTDASQIQIQQLEVELDGLITNRESLVQDRHYYDIVALMLKDSGIKTKVIKQYLPIINNLVNRYLSALDFFVNFTLDENFQESIKSRNRDDFSYSSFSEGEKMRIDLSLLFTWREVARLKNSASTNLLILDEIFDGSMDSNGIEDFLKLMTELHSNVNIFIISHRGDLFQDKFDQTIKFKKIGNFSQIVTE